MRHADELTYCKILKTNINVTNMEQTISYITQNLEDELEHRGAEPLGQRRGGHLEWVQDLLGHVKAQILFPEKV